MKFKNLLKFFKDAFVISFLLTYLALKFVPVLVYIAAALFIGTYIYKKITVIRNENLFFQSLNNAKQDESANEN